MRNKFLLALTIFSLGLGYTNKGFAQEAYKFTSVNMDNSAKFLIISSKQDLSGLSLKQQQLTNPNRLFVDLDDAVLTTPKQSFLLKNNHLQNIKVAQFSSHPKVVRIVFAADDKLTLDKIRVLKNKNSLIFKMSEPESQNNYFSTIYSDEKWSNHTKTEYSKTFVMKEIEEKLISADVDYCNYDVNNKYSITSADIKNGHIVINGIGVLSMKQPFILNNPSRIIFDIPDSQVSKEISAKDYKLNATDSLKIGQFEQNTVRIVVTTPNPQKYKSIITPDLQNLIIVEEKDIAGLKFDNKANISCIKSFKNADKTRTIEINANNPIYHSMNRTNSEMEFDLYNVSSPSTDVLKDIPSSVIQSKTPVSSTSAKLSIPLDQSSKIKYILSLDGKTLKITYTEPNIAPAVNRIFTHERPTITPPSKGANGLIGLVSVTAARGKTVVLDPGHGGIDVGATRDGVFEKDINLAVAKKIKKYLMDSGVNVIMTREKDETVSLKARTDLSNSSNTDLFVSIHVNSTVGTQATGLETHWFKMEELSLARIAHQNMTKAVNSPDRGIIKSNFYVLRNTTKPSILLEIGFISNDAERKSLQDDTRQENTARSITNGILLYFGETNGNK